MFEVGGVANLVAGVRLDFELEDDDESVISINRSIGLRQDGKSQAQDLLSRLNGVGNVFNELDDYVLVDLLLGDHVVELSG